MILSLVTVSIAVFSKNIIDAAAGGKINLAVKYAALFVFVIIIQITLDGIYSAMSTRTLEALSNNIRLKLYEKLSAATWMDYSKYHSEDILTRMTSDIGTVTNGVINVLPGIVSLGTRLIAAFITLFLFEPVLAVAAFGLGPFSVLISRFFVRKLKYMHIKIQEAESTYRAYIHEAVQNMLIIKAFNLEKPTGEKIRNLQNDRQGWIYKRSRFSAVSNSVLSLSYWAGYFLAFIWGAVRLSAGAITFGTLTAFLQLAGQIQGPIVSLARNIPQLIAMLASSERLMEFNFLESERDGSQELSWPLTGIRFENVTFSYESEKIVLKEVNFEIRSGDIVVLTGPSGEGKTTIIRLLLSLIRAQQGRVRFMGRDNTFCEACVNTRKLIAYVPQGNTLFSGTIAENLRAGCSTSTDEEIKEALESAYAWDFVASLSEGINTRIGERGKGLSEGQAQRIAIARAFLRKAPILIFDEATSALDAATEINILQMIRRLTPSRTCIIISHRPAALKICDRVLKLEDGNIFEYREDFKERKIKMKEYIKPVLESAGLTSEERFAGSSQPPKGDPPYGNAWGYDNNQAGPGNNQGGGRGNH